MPAESLQTEVFVLLKKPPGDAFQNFTAFSPELGNLVLLQRVAKKTPLQTPALDLFDEAAVTIETSNQGKTYFVKEARVLRRHAEIGRSYDTLRFASALSALIARNRVHEESHAAVAALLRTAFAAFAQSERPDIVYFKAVYRFARDEGYPLKEEWFPTLPAADRTAVTTLVNRPLSEQTEAINAVERLRRRLEEYLRRYTDIFVDAK